MAGQRKRSRRRREMTAVLGTTLGVFGAYAAALGSLLVFREPLTELAAGFGYVDSERAWLALVLAANVLACPAVLLAFYAVSGAFGRRLRLAFRSVSGADLVSLLKNFSIHFGVLIIIGTLVGAFGLEDVFESSEDETAGLLLLGLWLPGLLLALAIPVFEESLFRGYLYARLRRSFGFWPAFLASGLLFSLLHYRFGQGLAQNVFIVAAILLLTYFITRTFEETRNLWMPIIFHGLHNGLIVLIAFLAGLLEEYVMLT